MSLHSWLQNLRSALVSSRGQRQRRPRGSLRAATYRPYLETLEDRRLLTFAPVVSYPVNHYPDAVVTGDFNGDGKLDVAVANGQFDGIAFGFDNTVSVLLGNGDGTFQQPPLTSPTGYNPHSIAVGDFNSDGKLDVATANGSVSVLLGNGDGTFHAPTNIDINSDASSVAVGDFNGDGRIDLGVASSVFVIDGMDDYGFMWGRYEAIANVLLGNGDGSFSAPNVTDLGSSYVDYIYSDTTFLSVATAVRINGDAFDDFVTVNTFGSFDVLIGDGDGVLQFAGSHDTDSALSSVAAGDVNGDGRTDLVKTNYSGGTVGVLLGDGSGGFAPAVNFATGGTPTSVVLGDFTGDGKLDIATANSSSNTASVLYGNGDGTFSSPLNSYDQGNHIAAGDFNGDGWLDAAIAWIGEATNNYSGYVHPLINDHSWPTPSVPRVSINDVMVAEGNTGTAGVTFTVTLSKAAPVDVTLHYETADITATAGSDYVAASDTLTIPAGQTTGRITVLVKGDRLAEANETFSVNLSSPTNAIIVDGQGNATILDNEPRISISDVTKSEGKKGKTTSFTFTVTLSASYDQAVTMSFQTVNGTATTSDGDYVAKTGTLTFAPGETRKTITIEVKGDSKKEANETFYLDLYGLSTNALFTKNRGLGTILNDD